ncbi:MAG TPA: DUF4352 domain-containing protein [Ktedonobacterales bacterium]
MQDTPQGNIPTNVGLSGQPTPPRGRPKWWYWAGGGILVVALCGACAGIASVVGNSGLSSQRTQMTTSQGSGGNTASGKPAAQTTSAATATPQSRAVPVGQTQTWDGVQVTITSATALQPGQYDSIKAGDEYLVAHVKIVNNSDKDYDYNELDFQIMNKSGNVTHTTFTTSYAANAELNSGTLTAGGGTVEGDLVFEVAQADHVAIVVWQPSILSSDVYGWKATY